MVLDMAANALGSRRAIGELRYGDVRQAAMRTASRILSESPAPVTEATFLENGAHLLTALFGAAWAGVSYAPLNFRLPEAVKGELLSRVQPAVLFDHSWLTSGESTGAPYPEEPERPAVLLFTSGTSSAPKTAVLRHDNVMAYVFNTLEFASAAEDEAVLLAVPPFHVAGVMSVL